MGLTGWYIHHHGAGHLTRFHAIRPYLPGDVIVFSSLQEPAVLASGTRWTHLDLDNTSLPDVPDPRDTDPTAGGLLHWAPLGHPGHTRRLATMANAIMSPGFTRFVVDVSVEVTLLTRLLGVATVVIAQPGDRHDRPHQLAYAAAARVLAPWPTGTHPAPVAHRLVEVGGISRFDRRVRTIQPDPDTVLVLGGTDENSLTERVARAAAATPDLRWSLIGASQRTWLDDPWEALQRAEIVVSSAGQNSIADLAAAGARAVVVPQPRPFEEQKATGRILARHRLAVVQPAWPDDGAWSAVLDRARCLEPDWTLWDVTGAAQRAAETIAETGT